VDRGPPELEKERTCTLRIDPGCAAPKVFDAYGDCSLEDEQQRLDRVGTYLKNSSSESVAYLIVYAARTSCIREADWRGNRAKNYLVDKYKLDSSRIIPVDGGVRDNLTIEIFISSRGTCGPLATPSILSSQAHIDGLCSDKYK